MDSQRVQTNRLSGHDEVFKCEPNESFDEEKVTFPLLSKNDDIAFIDSLADNDVSVTGKPENDLNSINSLKTDSETAEEVNKLSVIYQNNDEDATSTNREVKFLDLGDADSICSSNPPREQTRSPIRGWGWMVVVISFLITTNTEGLASCYGLINIELVYFFEHRRASISLIGNLFLYLPLIVGPIASVLVDRFGCKNTTILGAVTAAIGFVAAACSNSVGALCLTYGLIAGFGLGLLNVIPIISTVYWFEKRRNLAIGFGLYGVGFGTFVYPQLTSYLVDKYTWKGALLILAGTVLNICVCGVIMRDPKWLILKQKNQRKLLEMDKASVSVSISAKSEGEEYFDPSVPSAEELKSMIVSSDAPEYILSALVDSITEAEDLETATKMNDDLLNQVEFIPMVSRHSKKIPAEALDYLESNKGLYNIILHKYPTLLQSINNLEQNLPKDTAPKHEDFKTKLYQTWIRRFFEMLIMINKTMHLNMFTELHFLMMVLSTLVLYTWFSVPYYFIFDGMKMSGYPDAQSYTMLNVFNTAPIAGFVAFGLLGDLPCVNVTKTYAVYLIVCGISIFIFPILISNMDPNASNSFLFLSLNGVVFGLMLSSSHVYIPTILVDLSTLERFTIAYGLVIFSQGVGHLTGPLMAGAIGDFAGWAAAFYVSGICVIIAGLMVGVIPYTKSFRVCGNAPLANEVEADPEPGVEVITDQ